MCAFVCPLRSLLFVKRCSTCVATHRPPKVQRAQQQPEIAACLDALATPKEPIALKATGSVRSRRPFPPPSICGSDGLSVPVSRSPQGGWRSTYCYIGSAGRRDREWNRRVRARDFQLPFPRNDQAGIHRNKCLLRTISFTSGHTRQNEARTRCFCVSNSVSVSTPASLS